MEALGMAAMMGSVDVSAAVILNFSGNFERNFVRYECEGLDPVTVEYINAQPNFLAILPIGPQKMVFVATLSASGVRYVAGQYEWWTKGSDATITDLQAEPQTPISCLEISETP